MSWAQNVSRESLLRAVTSELPHRPQNKQNSLLQN